ncbi:MAG: hypothetical protein IKW08_04430 [Roseburia sp.]|nr:hypothetical protein [Roseburia sp.]
MEVLLGMIMLLQVFVSIQIMLAHKQVLQRLKKMENSIKETLEKDVIEEEENSSDLCGDEKSTEKVLFLECDQEEKKFETYKKEAPESLINEVLSEVFP